ncbi:MAG: YaiI/YqxD family protein [Bacillota bacterium]
MRIIIDGDSCPVIEETFEAGRSAGVEVIMFCTYAHFSPERRKNTVLVDSEYQSVDMAIANELRPDDVLVADDIGLAAIALGKGAQVVSSRGRVFDNDNIDQALFQRFLSGKARKAGRRTKGPSKILSADRKRFQMALYTLINKDKRK